MAEAIVSFAVGRLGELLISEAKLLYGVRDQINEILGELKRMQCFLREADEKQNQDARVRQWVEDMRELAFKTEDVTETFAMEVPSKKQRSGFKQVLRRFACIFSEGVSRHNIATDINAIKAKISNLTESLKTYGITKGLDEGETSSSLVDLKSRRTYPHDIEKDFVGMEEDIEQLISYLKMKGPGCEVVSICGMGGQGKTTLAKKLYNHPQVKAHFQAFAWVCVTQQLEREKVLKGVLKELLPHDMKGQVERMDDAELVQELYKVQQEKNCLIVMDDIWKDDHWSSLKPAFPVGETTSGSKVLLTTRDAKVANMDNIVHNISVLTEEEGLQLLSKKVGIIINLPERREMETIGRNMVKKCKGLPLAISSLGGILKGKSLKDWEKINKDIPHYLAKGAGVTDDGKYKTVMWVLGLSYDSLPPHLRHCFLCFAHYPEDKEIETEELYMFWLAEGLISVEHKAEGEMMLDVAERYLDELAHRSLVQVDKCQVGESWSTYRGCRVHDLIRELCLGKAKEEKVIHVIHLPHTPEDASTASIVRRLCICSYEDGDESKLKPYDQNVISHIRSLLVWKIGGSGYAQWPDEIISLEKFKLLRVLTVRGYPFGANNITCISKLVYLKYLCIDVQHYAELPSSIGDLRNLETLELRIWDGSMEIPNVLWKLEHLKHLYLPAGSIIARGRVEKLRLKGLNKLQVIHNFKSEDCDAHDLLELPKLKVFSGTIVVEDNLTAENIFDYIKSSELRHSQLTIEGGGGLSCFILLLECCFIDDLTISTRICRFPKEYDHTRFSVRLTKLWLGHNCRIEEDPMILLEKLPNLRRLGLSTDAYLGAEMICSAMGFPQLQELGLYGLTNLRKWRVDQGAMPNLSWLTIHTCTELEMLPEGLTYLTALRDLNITNMPTTFTNKIKEEDGVDFYKISHISRVYI